MFLPETRVVAFARIERERRLPARGEVSATVGSRLEPLDVIARTVPPRARRALSLTRVLGVREADVPKQLMKQVGDSVVPREIIIAKPINFGLQQLVYRAPGAGQIVSIQGSWMVLDLDGLPVDLTALYRGQVVSLVPRFGAVLEALGALVQAVWASGKEGYGVIKMMAKTPRDVLEAEAVDVGVRGSIVIAGAGVTEEALHRAEASTAHGLVVGSLHPSLRALARSMPFPVLVTEGFGSAPMSTPIFELLSKHNGHEVVVSGEFRARGGSIRPEIFIPLMTGRLDDPGAPSELAPLEAKPGARVRVICEPGLGHIGSLSQPLETKWTPTESGARLPSVEIEWNDAPGERAIIPWANLELIG